MALPAKNPVVCEARTLSLLSLLAALLFTGVPGGLLADEPTSTSAPAANQPLQLNKILAGENCLDAEPVHRYFTTASPEQLHQLCRDDDLSTSLFAHWTLWRAAPPEDGMLFGKPQRFVGYLEGRTRISVPESWEYFLLTSGLFPHQPELVRQASKEYRRSWLGLHDGYVKGSGEFPEKRTLPEAEVTSIEGGLRITEGQTSVITHDQEIIEAINGRRRGECIGLYKCGDIVYLTIYSQWIGRSFPLWALDAAEPITRWKQVVWGCGSQFKFDRYNGSIVHDVLVQTDSSKITIFGMTRRGECYVESFDAQSGAVLFRFCTNYWERRMLQIPSRRGLH